MQQTAIESDLLERGHRLRHLCRDDHDLNWCDLRAIVDCVRPDSALARAIRPTEWQWQLDTLLLAEAVDTLHLLFWAKTKAGHEGRGEPERIIRPGVKDERERFGNEPVSITEMNEFLGWDAA